MNKNQKVIAILLIAILVISVVVLGLRIVEKKEIQRRSERNKKTLVQLAKAIPLDLFDIMKPTILIYMNTECEHCQWQLKEMANIEESLKETQIILVSFEPLDSLRSYFKQVPFKNRDRFTTYQILPEKVDQVFGSSGVPQIYVYKKNRLVKSFKGETRVESISEALNI